jgi:type I restriction enzyme R subunit
MGLCASASDITLPILENVRRKLRRLVKLIEPKDRKIVYTDFEDGIGAAIEMEAQPMIL